MGSGPNHPEKGGDISLYARGKKGANINMKIQKRQHSPAWKARPSYSSRLSCLGASVAAHHLLNLIHQRLEIWAGLGASEHICSERAMVMTVLRPGGVGGDVCLRRHLSETNKTFEQGGA